MMDENMMRKSALRAKRWNIFIFSIFAVMFTVLLIGVCVFKYQQTYSKNKWDTDKERRYKIVSDMLNKNPLIGLTEGEVVALLGEEDGNGPARLSICGRDFPLMLYSDITTTRNGTVLLWTYRAPGWDFPVKIMSMY